MSASGPDRPRVLVVDDDRLSRDMVRDTVAMQARVELCPDAETALEALARESADLVISDLTMPGLSGTELLERMRREHPGTDFMLITANASIESAVRALRMGASDYLSKPLRAEELALVVERILFRRRLLAENERLRDELRTVEACAALVRCLDPGEVYAVALDLLLASLGCERGLALFRRTGVPTSDGLAFRSFRESEVERLRAAVAEKPIDFDAIQEPCLALDSELHDALRDAGLATGRLLMVPVRGREAEAGVVCVFEGSEPFAEGVVHQGKMVAGHAGIALQNAERYHRAKERAFIDDVTEVYNARFLLQATEREIQRADRYEKDLCVLFLDLDRFKTVNDNHGHLVGSDVLRQLSRVLTDCIRQVDTLARYGGDEFTIVLVDTALGEGLAVAERIRRTVADTFFEGGRSSPIRLTISIGVASFPHHARDRDGLLDAADKAMYRAKSRGRNCCCSASDLDQV